jgi:hypothetical protein
MWNEHFGISIVEMMAAGLLTIAHNSGFYNSCIQSLIIFSFSVVMILNPFSRFYFMSIYFSLICMPYCFKI